MPVPGKEKSFTVDGMSITLDDEAVTIMRRDFGVVISRDRRSLWPCLKITPYGHDSIMYLDNHGHGCMLVARLGMSR